MHHCGLKQNAVSHVHDLVLSKETIVSFQLIVFQKSCGVFMKWPFYTCAHIKLE